MDSTDLLAGTPQSPAPPPLHILGFLAEDVKRIEVVEITPDGALVQLTGKNGSGKTSVLDCISWALEDATHIQVEPIRRGAKRARIRLDLGEVIVERTFTASEGGTTTSLSVRTPEGAEYRRPRALLDGFLGALSMDPVAFVQRMDDKARFTALRPFVPAVDFEAVAAANEKDFAARRELNAEARRQNTLADRMTVPRDADLPDVAIDVSAIEAELEQAGHTNTEIETRRLRREQTAAHAERMQEEAFTLRRQAERLREQAAVLIAQAEQTETDAAAAEHASAALTTKLAEAEPLPEPVDTAAIRTRLNQARGINTMVDVRTQRDAARTAAEAAERAARDLTEQMNARRAAMNAQIAAAALPVPGLTLTPEGGVRLNDLPFDQASDADQLRASIAVAMALNPRLRVIRVRDGSLLDADGMLLLAGMAKERGYQVWVERVGTDSETGIELVAGRVRKRAPAEASA
ncbi:MAG TPA: AAA family ATPase [Acetobacteraceae bacterium]|nr:AAA family ATPase [Acetobacteraceae bacterium]